MNPRLGALALVWMCSLAVPVSGSLAGTIRVDFAGVVATAPYADYGLSGIGAFSTVGAPITGYATYDPDLLHLVNSIPPYYEFDAPNRGFLHVESGSEVAESLIPVFDIHNSAPGAASGDSWGLGTNFVYINSVLNSVFAPISLKDPTGTVISSTSFFTPGSLAGWTSAEMIFRTEVLPGYGSFVLSTVTLTQWSVSAVPEPSAFALLGTGMLLFGLRRAHAR